MPSRTANVTTAFNNMPTKFNMFPAVTNSCLVKVMKRNAVVVLMGFLPLAEAASSSGSGSE